MVNICMSILHRLYDTKIEVTVQTAQDDIDTERAAYQLSRQGLDTMYQDIQQRLHQELLSKQVTATKHYL